MRELGWTQWDYIDVHYYIRMEHGHWCLFSLYVVRAVSAV